EFATSPTTGGNLTRNSLVILPHSILLVTLVLPHILSWFLGILAIINIAKYARQVQGNLYRDALKNLIRGIAGVIFFTVVYQIILFASQFLANLSLGLTLLIIYLLLILYALGFLFVQAGAKKLMRIEVVQ